jgi:CheY-like chemotaxis protein
MGLPGNRRVLVVDDDPNIRLLLATFLRHQGFQLLEACNGREALTEMRAGNADVVVMDLMMPEVSGWDVLRERAADPSLQRIPMIVVSASNSPTMTADVIDKRVSAVLRKPFDLDALLTAVTTCLEHPNVLAQAAA